MKKAIYPNLFKPMKLNGLRLKNRITMAPLYLGYAASGGTVSPLLLYHHKLMAQSGAAMIVVENACNGSCRESRPSARGGARKSEPSIASCSSKYEAFK
jgi:2,4-dienoyl-CoA reductase-like NADH-dependent reductase (Old Yellow Enzyme family)